MNNKTHLMRTVRYSKYWLLLIINYSLLIINCFALATDKLASPQIISSAEIYLLADTPASAFYQPATQNTGVAVNHSNPFGFAEINVFHLASQFPVKNEVISAGVFTLQNEIIADNVFYIGYMKAIKDIKLGSNIRYYYFSIDDYDTITVITANIAATWQSSPLSHGLSYSNITHSKTKGIDLPSTLKYECMLTPLENTRFAIALEKEKNYEGRLAFAVTQNLHKALAITTGFINKPSQFSAGFGINVQKIKVCYATRNHSDLGWTQAIGIEYKR